MKTQVARCLSTWHSAGVQETENPDSIDIAPLWGGEKGCKTCLDVHNSLDSNLGNETINPANPDFDNKNGEVRKPRQ